MVDSRRSVPRTDAVLADSRLASALQRHPRDVVRHAVRLAQHRCRIGEIAPDDVAAVAAATLTSGLQDIINATGVVLHTNLGRAPLSDAARAALDAASRGYSDVELDLETGARRRRGTQAEAALLAALPAAEAGLVVNNGAAALVLACRAIAGDRPVVVSRGELVEIGDGFRLTTILEAAGVALIEVGATNRTTLADYRAALDRQPGLVLKVHTSNFRIDGFAASVGVRDLASLGLPVVVDLGSGLLQADPLLPDEPDATSALRDGAGIVLFSGDKLLGGPQAGVVAGRRDLVESMRRHPLARALRVDKLTLAALTATLRDAEPPTWQALRATNLHERAARIVAQLAEGQGGALPAHVIATESTVGGGSGPGVALPSAAVALPESYARLLRTGTPPVIGRVHGGLLLLDLRAVPPQRDADIVAAVQAIG